MSYGHSTKCLHNIHSSTYVYTFVKCFPYFGNTLVHLLHQCMRSHGVPASFCLRCIVSNPVYLQPIQYSFKYYHAHLQSIKGTWLKYQHSFTSFFIFFVFARHEKMPQAKYRTVWSLNLHDVRWNSWNNKCLLTNVGKLRFYTNICSIKANQ